MSTVNNKEIQKFEQIANQWWDPHGKFKTLHDMNPIRMKFICDEISKHFPNKDKKLIKVLDVGCGGGLITEPLARIGFDVTAIDASAINIDIAKIHAKKNNLNIKYHATSLEDFNKKNKKFDIVTALEIVEHVDNVEDFITHLSQSVKKDGLLFISTINKTFKSYFQAIFLAENILKWAPKGAHEYEKFLSPNQISNYLKNNNFSISASQGMKYSIIKNNWYLSNDCNVNYIICYKKV